MEDILSQQRKTKKTICNEGIACRFLEATEHKAFCPALSLLKAKESLRETPWKPPRPRAEADSAAMTLREMTMSSIAKLLKVRGRAERAADY